MTKRIGILLCLSLVWLVGCSGAGYRRPAPVVDAGSRPVPAPRPSETQAVPPSEPGSEVQVAVLEAPQTVREQPVTSTAVAGLLARVDEQEHAGDITGAAATLERALRIEPRNAHLWNRLAQLRYQQRQYGQVADLAAKSNTLAGADQRLRRDNWQLIAKARQAAGDEVGARAAQRQAELLR